MEKEVGGRGEGCRMTEQKMEKEAKEAAGGRGSGSGGAAVIGRRRSQHYPDILFTKVKGSSRVGY